MHGYLTCSRRLGALDCNFVIISMSKSNLLGPLMRTNSAPMIVKVTTWAIHSSLDTVTLQISESTSRPNMQGVDSDICKVTLRRSKKNFRSTLRGLEPLTPKG